MPLNAALTWLTQLQIVWFNCARGAPTPSQGGYGKGKGLGARKGELRATSSLLLNFCVRLRSKLSKINFHVEKLQIALSNRDGNREKERDMLLLVRARCHPLKWSVFSSVCAGLGVCVCVCVGSQHKQLLLGARFCQLISSMVFCLIEILWPSKGWKGSVRARQPEWQPLADFTYTDILTINGK